MKSPHESLLVALMLLGPPSASASNGVATVPGNTVVQDEFGDLLLRNCELAFPEAQGFERRSAL